MTTVTSLSQVTEAERMEWLNKPYSIDVETTGLDYVHDELIGVALYVNDESYYFVLKHSTGEGNEIREHLSLDDLRVLLSPILMQQSVVASLHNAKFDLHFLSRYDLWPQSRIFDTLMAAQLLNENRRNDLKSLTSLVDDEIEHVKYEQLATLSYFPKGSPLNVELEAFSQYAQYDVIVTYKLWQQFRKDMAKDTWRGTSIQDVFNTLWMPMVPVLQEMEYYGFKIDVEKSQELLSHYAPQIAANREIVERAGYEMLARKPVEEIAGYYWKTLSDEDRANVYSEFDEDIVPDGMLFNESLYLDIHGIKTPVIAPTPRSALRRLVFNVASSEQLVELILGDIELPPNVELVRTKTGEESVNVENLMIIKHYLGDNAPHYIDALLAWRKAEKFVSTYLDAFVNKTREGRLHCFFSMAANDMGRGGTRTGRLSSSNINLQNIPSRGSIGQEARDLFIADEGNMLIAADYSNMETVVFAHFSQDPVLLKAFSEGLDVHALTACGQHGLEYDQFVAEYKNGNPEYDAMRRTAKTLLFGQAYGMGAVKLQRTLLVQNGQEYTVEEASKMLDAFNETYAVMAAWKKRVNEFAGEHGFVPTILGRKRRLPLVHSHDREIRSRAMRQGVNATIQGSCADILFQAMPPIQAAFKAMGGSLVASVHDELIGEVAEPYAEAAAHTMERLMVDLINPKLRCKLKAEAGIGRTWKEAKG